MCGNKGQSYTDVAFLVFWWVVVVVVPLGLLGDEAGTGERTADRLNAHANAEFVLEELGHLLQCESAVVRAVPEPAIG